MQREDTLNNASTSSSASSSSRDMQPVVLEKMVTRKDDVMITKDDDVKTHNSIS